MSNDVVIRYTNNSYLNITTAMKYAAVNGTIGVTITVDGIGYQAGRPPADVIFVMDRSGSMGDAQGFTNYGANVGGWLGATVLDETSQVTKNAVTNFTYNHMLNTRMSSKPGRAVMYNALPAPIRSWWNLRPRARTTIDRSPAASAAVYRDRSTPSGTSRRWASERAFTRSG